MECRVGKSIFEIGLYTVQLITQMPSKILATVFIKHKILNKISIKPIFIY